MPRRAVLIRIAQVVAFAAALAVLAAVVLLRTGDGDDLPEPPVEGAHVFAGEDGWFFAIEEEPDAYVVPRIWVQLAGLRHEADSIEPPPIKIVFQPEFSSPPLEAEVQSYMPQREGSEWFEVSHGIYLPEGELDLTITQTSNGRPIVKESVQISYVGRVNDINFQSWEAELLAYQQLWQIGYPDPACRASLPYDETKGYWEITCESGECTEDLTVTAETGELRFSDWSHSVLPPWVLCRSRAAPEEEAPGPPFSED